MGRGIHTDTWHQSNQQSCSLKRFQLIASLYFWAIQPFDMQYATHVSISEKLETDITDKHDKFGHEQKGDINVTNHNEKLLTTTVHAIKHLYKLRFTHLCSIS